MKLLLDENVSDTIVSQISDLFPDSSHTKTVGLKQSDDGAIWDWAKQHAFTIVSKDTDYALDSCVSVREGLGRPSSAVTH